MFDSMKSVRAERSAGASCFAAADALHGSGALVRVAHPHRAAAPATAGKLQLGPDIYKSIGVRPVINCRGHPDRHQRLARTAGSPRGGGRRRPASCRARRADGRNRAHGSRS